MKLILYIIVMVFIIQVVNADEFGDITIGTNEVWKDQLRVHAGNISLKNGSNLIIDNTTIIFNGSYGIYVDAHYGTYFQYTSITTKNNTKITVLDKNTMWVSLLIKRGAHFNFSDTTFERMCGGCFYAYETGLLNPMTSTFENVTMTDYGTSGEVGAFFTQNTADTINILNSTFISNTTLFPQFNSAVVIYFITPNANPVGRLEGNLFMNSDRAFQITGLPSHGMRLINNTLINPTNTFSFFSDIEDSYQAGNIVIHNNSQKMYTNQGCNKRCNNITFENNIIYGSNANSDWGDELFHFNYEVTNVTIRNNIGIGLKGGMGSGSISAGLGSSYFQVYNNTINGSSRTSTDEHGYGIYANNSLVYNNIFSDMIGSSSTCILQQAVVTAPYYPYNITFTNNTCNNTYDGIVLNHATNLLFRDNKLTNILHYDVKFNGYNSNIKFINNNMLAPNLYFSDNNDSFDNYYYTDILVQDMNGNPIDGATISAVNEVNSRYPSIDRTGANRTTFSTGTDGHTKLPIGNDSNTLVLMAYSQNKT